MTTEKEARTANNWFSQQGIQSIDKIDGMTIRVSKFKLDGIASTTFHVTMYIDFWDSDNNMLADKSRQEVEIALKEYFDILSVVTTKSVESNTVNIMNEYLKVFKTIC